MLENYLELSNAHLEIRYVKSEQRYAQDAFETLNKAIPAITRYFQISQSRPKARVVFVPHRNEFDRLVRDLLRVEIEFPSHPSRIAQSQRTDMVVLSPSVYKTQSSFDYISEHFSRLLVHELIHMVEEHLSPNIEANPRWWSEGLAVYISYQWRYEDEFRKTAIDSIKSRTIPSLFQIENDNKLAYDWGWAVVRFMGNVFGKEMFLRIVKECADGNVFSITEEGMESLENKWMNWTIL
ncbi:MAG: collagenase [Anaerolineales bacterium]|nr:collagenase [Anaerolineales bacterium]